MADASRFSAVGLDDDAAHAFEVLATDERCTGSIESVAACSHLSEAEADRALATLSELGLVFRHADDGSFTATAVEAAVGALIAGQREELAKVETAARELAVRAARREQRLGAEQLVSIVVGGDHIRMVQEQLVRSARRTVRCFDRPPYVTVFGLVSPPQVDPLQAEAISTGVHYRTVYDAMLLDDPLHVARIREDVNAGEEGRVLTDLPVKMMMADDSLALLPLLDRGEGADPAALVVRPSILLDSLGTLFELLWRAAAPLTFSADTVEDDDTARKQLVALLIGGLSERQLARALQVSERTVRRRIGELRETLGVDTMFQAGTAAAQRGWV